MASLNESLFNTPVAKRAIKLHESRIAEANAHLKAKGLSEMNYERKLATAICLENTRRQIKAINEGLGFDGATQPASIGQYKRYAMDMVATLMPTLIAPEVVSVQAVDNRVGMINILEYQYGSTKAPAENGQTFASPLGYQGMNISYTSSYVDGEALKADLNVNSLAWQPYVPGSLTVFDQNTGAAKDVTVGGDGAITGAVAGDIAFYRYNNEDVAVKSPQLKMNIRSLPITTKSRKLSAVWSFDAQYELTKEYGQDMHSLLATQATAEIEQEIDNEITLDLYRIANAGPEIIWHRAQPTGVNIMDHYDSFYNKIVEGSNQIFAATRRAHANFMICGLNVSAVLKCMRNFTDSEDLTAIGPHFLGTLGSIKCYVNPNYGADEFVLGYKGSSLIDSGYVYAPYMPILTTGMVTLADDFAAREGWATQYGTRAINPRLYLKGRIA